MPSSDQSLTAQINTASPLYDIVSYCSGVVETRLDEHNRGDNFHSVEPNLHQMGVLLGELWILPLRHRHTLSSTWNQVSCIRFFVPVLHHSTLSRRHVTLLRVKMIWANNKNNQHLLLVMFYQQTCSPHCDLPSIELNNAPHHQLAHNKNYIRRELSKEAKKNSLVFHLTIAVSQQ